MVVTTRHLFTIPGFNARRGFCRDKSRVWAESHGFDWHAFVRHGIEADKLLATGDGFALALVEWARKCAAEEAAHG